MRTIAFSRATHNRLYVRTLNHHYDYMLKRTRCFAPFILHIIYTYMSIYIYIYIYIYTYIHTYTHMVQRTIYTVQVTKEFYIQYTREVSTMHALHVRTWRRLSQGQFPTPTVEEKGEQGGDH
jgi:hypothetical protein